MGNLIAFQIKPLADVTVGDYIPAESGPYDTILIVLENAKAGEWCFVMPITGVPSLGEISTEFDRMLIVAKG